jgi:hypothetical protein
LQQQASTQARVKPAVLLPDLLLLARCRLQLLPQLLQLPLLLLQPQQQLQQQPPDPHQLLLLRLALQLQQLLLLRQQTLLLLLDPLPSPQHLQRQAALPVLLLLLGPLHNPLGSQLLSCNRLRSPQSLHQQQLQQRVLLQIPLDTPPCRLLALPWAVQLLDCLLLLPLLLLPPP